MVQKHFILAEKNYAAREFAKALGGMSGVYQGIAYEISAASGHLLELLEPHEMVPKEKEAMYKSWQDLDSMPWPASDFSWRKRPAKRKDKKTGRVTTTGALLKSLREQAMKCDVFVIATDLDPSGEGEMIGWEVVDAIGWKGPVKRMNFYSEAAKDVQEAFVNMVDLDPNKRKDGDYLKAESRQYWDFMSMQLTRVATVVAQQNQASDKVVREGRLKSVMVKMVYDRLEEIKNYVKRPYYEARFKDDVGNVFKRKVDKEDPEAFFHKELADAETEVKSYKQATVQKIGEKVKYQAPPMLYTLSDLGAILSKRGFTTKEVNDTYQKMYEAQIVSYPRTEDNYISPEQFNEMLPFVDEIARVVDVDVSLLSYRKPRKNHVKTGGAHGANRPGKKVPKRLNDLQAFGKAAVPIYELVAKNFLAMFGENYEYTSVEANLKEYPEFTATLHVPSGKPCFKDVFNAEQFKEKDASDDDETGTKLGTKADPFVYEGSNKKPSQPTLTWLMNQITKYGVGTGATRNETFTAVSSGSNAMIRMNKGKLSLNELGYISAHLLQGTYIGSVKATAQLQDLISQIGKFQAKQSQIFTHVIKVVAHDKDVMVKNGKTLVSTLGLKPVAKRVAKEKVTKRFVDGTDRTISRVYSGHRFTDEELEALFAGETIQIQVEASDDKCYSVKGKLEEYMFKNRKIFGFKREAPKPKTMENAKIPESYAGHVFSKTEIQQLRQGKTIELVDCVSGKGNVFSAFAKLGPKEYNGHKYIGLVIEFPERESTIPKKLGTYEFTDEELKQLENG